MGTDNSAEFHSKQKPFSGENVDVQKEILADLFDACRTQLDSPEAIELQLVPLSEEDHEDIIDIKGPDLPTEFTKGIKFVVLKPQKNLYLAISLGKEDPAWSRQLKNSELDTPTPGSSDLSVVAAYLPYAGNLLSKYPGWYSLLVMPNYADKITAQNSPFNFETVKRWDAGLLKNSWDQGRTIDLEYYGRMNESRELSLRDIQKISDSIRRGEPDVHATQVTAQRVSAHVDYTVNIAPQNLRTKIIGGTRYCYKPVNPLLSK